VLIVKPSLIRAQQPRLTLPREDLAAREGPRPREKLHRLKGCGRAKTAPPSSLAIRESGEFGCEFQGFVAVAADYDSGKACGDVC